MRPVPIDNIPEGMKRVVIAPPDGDFTNEEVSPVEALVGMSNLGLGFYMKIRLEPEDISKILAGYHEFWYIQHGDHLHPFAMEFMEDDD